MIEVSNELKKTTEEELKNAMKFAEVLVEQFVEQGMKTLKLNDLLKSKYQYEKQLKQQNAYFDAINNEHLSYIIIDRKKQVVDFNRKTKDNVNILLARKIQFGTLITDYIPTEEKEIFNEHLEKAFNGETLYVVKEIVETDTADNEENWTGKTILVAEDEILNYSTWGFLTILQSLSTAMN